MSVRCATCNTENRESAMFCRGCAGKLPAFVATGPSALQSLGHVPIRQSSAHPLAQAGRLPLETRRFLVASTGVALIACVAFVGWYAYVTRSASAPRAAVIDAASPSPAAAPVTAIVAVPLPASTPVTPAASMARGELIVEPGPEADAKSNSGQRLASPAAGAAPGASASTSAPNSGSNPASASSPMRSVEDRRSNDAASRPAALDPQQGCMHLNFILAARCTANHCASAAYSRHPRCDAVREERRRDEARRNPTLGY